MSYKIRKKFRVEYAHQLSSAYSKCCTDQIHGHSGIIELFLYGSNLNEDGMIIDFGKVKKLIGPYIESWDHMLIMPNTLDKAYLRMLKKHNKNLKIVDYNPTAENMAREISNHITKIIRTKFMAMVSVGVRFHETDTGYAEFEGDS